MKNIHDFIIKNLFFLLLIIACYEIQSTVMIKLICKPNLVLLSTCSIGFIYGERSGMYTGFVSGLLIDCFYGPVMGFNMLIFIVLGFFAALMGRLFYKDQILFPIVLMTLCDFFYNFYYYFFRMLLRKQINFPYYFEKVFLPEIVSTLVVTVIVYYILYKLDNTVFKKDSGSELTFD